MFKNKIFKLIITIIVITAFLANIPAQYGFAGEDLFVPVIAADQAVLNNFLLSSDLGTIDRTWFSQSLDTPDVPRLVIHIQDAHCNYPAQQGIVKILDHLSRNYGITVVNMEGASGDYDLSIFNNIEGKNIKSHVADHFLREGLISGAEYYAINNPGQVKLWGVENPELYLENLNIYKDVLKSKAKINEYLITLESALKILKQRVYNSELLELDNQYFKFKRKSIKLEEYIEYLFQYAGKNNIELEDLSDVYFLRETFKQKNNIDFKKADIERSIIIDKLQRMLSKYRLENLISRILEFETDKISLRRFYAYLFKEAKAMALDVSPFCELKKYTEYISTYSKVDQSKIIEEIEALDERLRERLYENNEQRELSLLSKNLVLITNIFNLEITKDEYKYFKDNRQLFNVRQYLTFIRKRSQFFNMALEIEDPPCDIDQELSKMDDFFICTASRDRAFLKNLKFSDQGNQSSCHCGKGISPCHCEARGKREPKQSLEDSKAHNQLTTNDQPLTTVLIAGGFHSENLQDILKQENISYISIIPNFKSPKDYSSPYLKRLSGEEPSFENNVRKAMFSTIAVTSFMNSLGIMAEGQTEYVLRCIHLRWMAATLRSKGLRVECGEKEFAINTKGEITVCSPETKDRFETVYVTELMPSKQLAGPKFTQQPVREEFEALEGKEEQIRGMQLKIEQKTKKDKVVSAGLSENGMDYSEDEDFSKMDEALNLFKEAFSKASINNFEDIFEKTIAKSSTAIEISKGVRYAGLYKIKGSSCNARVIKKKMNNVDRIKDFFSVPRTWCCPTFFVKGDTSYVYELDLSFFGYTSIYRFTNGKTGDLKDSWKAIIRRAIFESFCMGKEWFTHYHLWNGRNILIKINNAGKLVDVKLMDWKYLEKKIAGDKKCYIFREKGCKDFTGQDLKELKIEGLDLNGINLSNADLSSSRLTWVSLKNSIMAGTVFEEAELTEVDLSHADLKGAKLRKAVLEYTDFRNAVLEGTVLDGADIKAAKFPLYLIDFFKQKGFYVEYKETWCEVTGSRGKVTCPKKLGARVFASAIHAKEMTQQDIRSIMVDIEDRARDLNPAKIDIIRTRLMSLSRKVEGALIEKKLQQKIINRIERICEQLDKGMIVTYTSDVGVRSQTQFGLGCILPDKSIALIDGFFKEFAAKEEYQEEILLHEILALIKSEKSHADHKSRYMSVNTLPEGLNFSLAGIQRQVFGNENPLKDIFRQYVKAVISKQINAEKNASIDKEEPIDGIDLWTEQSIPGLAEELKQMAEDIKKCTIRNFSDIFDPVGENEVSEKIKKGKFFEGVYRYKEGTLGIEVIKKGVVNNLNEIKSFFRKERKWCCPTFFVKGDEENVYELNLRAFGYKDLEELYGESLSTMSHRIRQNIIKTVSETFCVEDDFFKHGHLFQPKNILVKLNKDDIPEDIKIIDWKFLRKQKFSFVQSRMIKEREQGSLRNKALLLTTLEGFDFENINLTRAQFTYVNMGWCNFRKAIMEGINFSGARLIGSDFSEADLRGANLENADCKGAELKGSDLRGAVLKKASFKGADLRGADLSGTNLFFVFFKKTKFDLKLVDFFRKNGFWVKEKESWCEVTGTGAKGTIFPEILEQKKETEDRELAKKSGQDITEKQVKPIDGIDLWTDETNPGLAEELKQMAGDVEKCTTANFNDLFYEVECDSEDMKRGSGFKGVFQYKQGDLGLQIIKKYVDNLDEIKDFFKEKHKWCCPTFFVEGDNKHVYELNLNNFRYEKLGWYLFSMTDKMRQSIIKVVSETFGEEKAFTCHGHLWIAGNILIKLGKKGELEDVKIIDWKNLEKQEISDEVTQWIKDRRQGTLINKKIPHYLILEGFNFENVDLSGSDFSNRDLAWSNLRNAVMQKGKFVWTHFNGSDMRGVDLNDANLKDAVLKGADLRGADLSNAELTRAHFDGADLRGAKLDGADLSDVVFEKTKFDLTLEEFLRERKFIVKTKGSWCEVRGIGKKGTIFPSNSEKKTEPGSIFPVKESDRNDQYIKRINELLKRENIAVGPVDYAEILKDKQVMLVGGGFNAVSILTDLDEFKEQGVKWLCFSLRGSGYGRDSFKLQKMIDEYYEKGDEGSLDKLVFQGLGGINLARFPGHPYTNIIIVLRDMFEKARALDIRIVVTDIAEGKRQRIDEVADNGYGYKIKRVWELLNEKGIVKALKKDKNKKAVIFENKTITCKQGLVSFFKDENIAGISVQNFLDEDMAVDQYLKRDPELFFKSHFLYVPMCLDKFKYDLYLHEGLDEEARFYDLQKEYICTDDIEKILKKIKELEQDRLRLKENLYKIKVLEILNDKEKRRIWARIQKSLEENKRVLDFLYAQKSKIKNQTEAMTLMLRILSASDPEEKEKLEEEILFLSSEIGFLAEKTLIFEASNQDKLTAFDLLKRIRKKISMKRLGASFAANLEIEGIGEKIALEFGRRREKVKNAIKNALKVYGPKENIIRAAIIADQKEIIPFIEGILHREKHDLDDVFGDIKGVVRGKTESLIKMFETVSLKWGIKEEIKELSMLLGKDSVKMQDSDKESFCERMKKTVFSMLKKIDNEFLLIMLVRLLSGLNYKALKAEIMWHALKINSQKDVLYEEIILEMKKNAETSISFLTASEDKSSDRVLLYKVLGDIGSLKAVSFFVKELKSIDSSGISNDEKRYFFEKITDSIQNGIGEKAGNSLLSFLRQEKEDNLHICMLLMKCGYSDEKIILTMINMLRKDILPLNRTNILTSLAEMDIGVLNRVLAQRPELKRFFLTIICSNYGCISEGKLKRQIENLLYINVVPEDLPYFVKAYRYCGEDYKKGGAYLLALLAQKKEFKKYFQEKKGLKDEMISLLTTRMLTDVNAAIVLSAIGGEKTARIFLEEIALNRDFEKKADCTILRAFMNMRKTGRSILLKEYWGLFSEINQELENKIKTFIYDEKEEDLKLFLIETYAQWMFFIEEENLFENLEKKKAQTEIFCRQYIKERKRIVDLTAELYEDLETGQDLKYDDIMKKYKSRIDSLSLKARVQIMKGIVLYLNEKQKVAGILNAAQQDGLKNGELLIFTDVHENIINSSKRDLIKELIGFVPRKARINFKNDLIHIKLDQESYARVNYRLRNNKEQMENAFDGWRELKMWEKEVYIYSGGKFDSNYNGFFRGIPLKGLLTFEDMDDAELRDTGSMQERIEKHEAKHKRFRIYANYELQTLLDKEHIRLLEMINRINKEQLDTVLASKRLLTKYLLSMVLMAYQEEMITAITANEWINYRHLSDWISFYRETYIRVFAGLLKKLDDKKIKEEILQKVFLSAEIILRRTEPIVKNIIGAKAQLIELEEGVFPDESLEKANIWTAAFLETIPATKFYRLNWLVEELSEALNKKIEEVLKEQKVSVNPERAIEDEEVFPVIASSEPSEERGNLNENDTTFNEIALPFAELRARNDEMDEIASAFSGFRNDEKAEMFSLFDNSKTSNDEKDVLAKRQPVVVDSFTTADRKADIVKVVVGVPKDMSKAKLQKTLRKINRGLAQSGFGSKTDNHQVITFEMDMKNFDSTKSNYQNAMQKAEELVEETSEKSSEDVKTHIVAFVPQMDGLKIAGEEQKRKTKKNITIIPDAYTDQLYPDITARTALARHIAFYYNGGDKSSAIASVNRLLSQISEGVQIADIQDLLNTANPLKITPIDYQDIVEWQVEQEAVVMSL
ncbi:MAG: pentapeptide repeat-containing protein [Candidatus Omnitrophota bacterium]